MTNVFSKARAEAIAFTRQKLAERPLYLDTETTGLERTDEIVEISIIDDAGECVFESFIRPSQPIPAASTRIHGITTEMVQSARPWPIVWPQIRALLAGRLIVIYNAEFDLRMMQQSHGRYRLPWRENLNAVCAMQTYAQFRSQWDPKRRGYRNFRLEEAGHACQIELPNAHRARADALLARALFHYIADQG